MYKKEIKQMNTKCLKTRVFFLFFFLVNHSIPFNVIKYEESGTRRNLHISECTGMINVFCLPSNCFSESSGRDYMDQII